MGSVECLCAVSTTVPAMQQWAEDLASASPIVRGCATGLMALSVVVLSFVVYLTTKWRRAPRTADSDHIRRWRRAVVVGTLVDLIVLALGIVMGWFGVLYAFALRNANVTARARFDSLIPAAVIVVCVVWANWKLVRSGFKDDGLK